MAINAAVGIILGMALLERSGGVAAYGIVFGLAWVATAVACAGRRPAARVIALVLAGIAIVFSLAAGRIELGTNLAIFILMLTPSARRAYEAV